MNQGEEVLDFSLLGGPLHRGGERLGLVRDGTDTVALGLALGALPWIVLVLLALVESLGHVLFSIESIGAHVRLLVAIPLLFVCESFVDPRFTAFVRGIVRSQVVPATERPVLDSEIRRVARWRDAWLPEACLLVGAVLWGLAAPQENFYAYLSGHGKGSNPGIVSTATWTSEWYWMACMTLFRFLFLRWFWRLALWCFFLWRIAGLELHLVSPHPDAAGGLGYLELVQTEFTPLVLAISAVQAASLAQDIASGRMAFDAIYVSIAFTLLIDALLFVGPLCVFSRTLWKCKVKGKNDYGELAERYVNEFESKWLGAGATVVVEPLLGSADIQSLADLSTSFAIVRDMRLVPISPSMLMYLAFAALVPLLPLVLFKYPITDLLAKFFERLSGL